MNDLEKIDDYIRLTFTNDSQVTDIYRFGSTLDKELQCGRDIDYLFLSRNSTRRQYISHLEKLAKHFNSDKVLSASFDASSQNFKKNIEKVIKELNTKMCEAIPILPRYCFGPFLRSSDKAIYLHLAGPLSNFEFQKFAELFPVFMLYLFKNNYKILGKSFSIVPMLGDRLKKA